MRTAIEIMGDISELMDEKSQHKPAKANDVITLMEFLFGKDWDFDNGELFKQKAEYFDTFWRLFEGVYGVNREDDKA